MLVFMEDAAEPVASADIEALDLLRVGHRFGKRAQGCGCQSRSGWLSK